MAKISELPTLAQPTGDETVPVVLLGETLRVGITPLVTAAAAPVIAVASGHAARSDSAADRSEAARNLALSAETTFGHTMAGSGQLVEEGVWDPNGEVLEDGAWSGPGARHRRKIPTAADASLQQNVGLDGELAWGETSGALYSRSRRTGMLIKISRPEDVLHLDQFTSTYLNSANATQFTAALRGAITAAKDLGGGQINVPIRPDQQGYSLEPGLIVPQNVRMKGVGGQAIIRPATVCTDLITVNGANIDLEGLYFDDSLRLVSGAVIAISGDVRSATGLEVRNLFVYGAKCGIRNDGAMMLKLRGGYTQNNETGFLNAKGGVDLGIYDHKSLGDKFPIILDGVSQPIAPGQPGTDHAEGITLRDVWLGGVQPGGTALTIRESLWVKMMRVECVVLGLGCTGVDIVGTERLGRGSTLIDIQQSYIEAGKNGSGLRARSAPGTVAKLAVSHTHFGTGSWRASDAPKMKFVDIDYGLDISLDHCSVFYGTGCGTIDIAHTDGEITSCDFSQTDGFVDYAGASNALVWNAEHKDMPPGYVPAGFSSYVRGRWTEYVPALTSSIGQLGSVVDARGRYRRDGNTMDFNLQATIMDKGDGAGVLLFALPTAARVGGLGWVPEVIGAVAAKRRGLLGYIDPAGGAVSITDLVGEFPSVNGLTINVSGTFEVAS